MEGDKEKLTQWERKKRMARQYKASQDKGMKGVEGQWSFTYSLTIQAIEIDDVELRVLPGQQNDHMGGTGSKIEATATNSAINK
mmetsp:Transcript_4228/g.7172  ORF Transcript_4228/g.7172 Transcript_4228/m.7172 type:complete len:84 (+) Transcript_4228:104-355(+)